MITLATLLPPFIVTVAVESALVTTLLWGRGEHVRILLVVILAHCLTHPFGAALYYFTPASLLFVECVVMLLEGLGYRVFLVRSWILAFGVSVVANLASFYIGPFIRAVLSS